MFIEATYQNMYIDVTRLYYYFFVSDLFFSPNQIRCKKNKNDFLFHEYIQCTGVFKYCGVWICF